VILKIVKTILRREGVREASLSIVFVSCQRIKAFNKKYLGREYATDVLAFDVTEHKATSRRRRIQRIDGDIIISTDAALKNARVFKTAVSQELVLYVIHGILHLLQYDDHKLQDKKKMRKREQELLSCLGSKVKSAVK